MQIFVTGTDTDIGKTTIASWLCLHLGYSYWKPIQTASNLNDTDSITVKNLSNVNICKENYLYSSPVSPHLAAKRVGQSIILDKILAPQDDRLIIEGAGGVLVPINEKYYMVDLIQKLNISVMLVASSRVGTINHTLLTLEALERRNIKVIGVIMNGENDDNKRAIEYYGKVKILFSFPILPKIDTQHLRNVLLPTILRDMLL